MYGGYTKLGRSTVASDDARGVVHTDLWCLDMRALTWSKVSIAALDGSPLMRDALCA